MKIVILGAGPTGLAIAHQLTKNNIEVDIYENSKEVGGFAKSIKLWDEDVEIGPHFLNIGHKPVVKGLVLQALSGNFKTYQRKTYIITLNKLFIYPPVISNILRKLSLKQLFLAASGIIKQSFIHKTRSDSAEVFVKNMIGPYLYTNFFKSFSRKLWALDADQLSEVFAKSLIGLDGKASLLSILYTRIRRVLNTDSHESMHIYPNNGLSGLWNALRQQIQEQGGRFHLSTSINELTFMPRKDKYIITHVVSSEGTVKPYDMFISTIPVQSLFKYLKITNSDSAGLARTIRYRNDVLVYLKVEFTNVVDGQSFYLYSDSISAIRITNFSAFDTGRQGSFHIILLEFWCDSNDSIWHADKNALLNEAINELSKTNIFKELKILDINVKKIENAFPVPDLHFVDCKDEMFEQLLPYQNLQVTGRNASVNFNYGMENAIEEGILIANKILADIQNNCKPVEL